MNRRVVNVPAYHGRNMEYDIPVTPNKFLAWWREKFDLVPDEFKSTTKVDLETDPYPKEGLVITISYDRPETDEELAQREQEERNRKSSIEEKELNELERLKKKHNA